MMRIGLVAAAIAIGTGCVIVKDTRPVTVVDYNDPPYVYDAVAGCFFDRSYGADVIYFDATVTDPDGNWDVAEVWADVYDDRVGGGPVQQFPLDPVQGDATGWASEWFADTSAIDCFYPYYSVDIVAYDGQQQTDVVTIYFDSYR